MKCSGLVFRVQLGSEGGEVGRRSSQPGCVLIAGVGLLRVCADDNGTVIHALSGFGDSLE